MEWLGIASPIIAIITFFVGAFHYVVLKPLKESIIDLKNLIEKMQHNIEEDEKMRHGLEIKVAKLEEQIESIDSKFGILSKYCMKTHGSQELLPLLARITEQD